LRTRIFSRPARASTEVIILFSASNTNKAVMRSYVAVIVPAVVLDEVVRGMWHDPTGELVEVAARDWLTVLPTELVVAAVVEDKAFDALCIRASKCGNWFYGKSSHATLDRSRRIGQ
jgi:hypothetical protein